MTAQDGLEQPSPLRNGLLYCCDECGSAGRGIGGQAKFRHHIETDRVLCGRCIDWGMHLWPAPPDRPILLTDLIRS